MRQKINISLLDWLEEKKGKRNLVYKYFFPVIFSAPFNIQQMQRLMLRLRHFQIKLNKLYSHSFCFCGLWVYLYLYFLTFRVVEQSLLSNIDIVFLRDSEFSRFSVFLLVGRRKGTESGLVYRLGSFLPAVLAFHFKGEIR